MSPRRGPVQLNLPRNILSEEVKYNIKKNEKSYKTINTTEGKSSAIEKAINNTDFFNGICPIYQNVATKPTSDPKLIKENLKKQLTSSVMWTQTMKQMIADGLSSVTEVGPGKVLQGLFKKIDRSMPTESACL